MARGRKPGPVKLPGVETLIRKRADGTEYIAGYKAVPWDAVAGKRMPSKTFDNANDAYEYKKAMERDRDQALIDFGITPKRNGKSIPFAEYARDFAITYPGTPNSKKDRRSVANVLGKRWAGKNLHDITRKMITEMLGEFENAGMAQGTRRRYVTFLRVLFKEAVLNGDLDEMQNPVRSIDSPGRTPERPKSAATESDVQAFLAEAKDWAEVAVLLAFDSGLRAAEVCGLRWHNVDFDNGMVTVIDVLEKDKTLRHYPKGKEQRTIPLSARTIQALRKARLAADPDCAFVVQRSGRPVSPHNLSGYWYRQSQRVFKDMSVAPRFHDLRHGFAYKMVAADIKMPMLQAFMGHKSIATTQVYMPTITGEAMRGWFDKLA